jgi:hypothetical protein
MVEDSPSYEAMQPTRRSGARLMATDVSQTPRMESDLTVAAKKGSWLRRNIRSIRLVGCGYLGIAIFVLSLGMIPALAAYLLFPAALSLALGFACAWFELVTGKGKSHWTFLALGLAPLPFILALDLSTLRFG